MRNFDRNHPQEKQKEDDLFPCLPSLFIFFAGVCSFSRESSFWKALVHARRHSIRRRSFATADRCVAFLSPEWKRGFLSSSFPFPLSLSCAREDPLLRRVVSRATDFRRSASIRSARCTRDRPCVAGTNGWSFAYAFLRPRRMRGRSLRSLSSPPCSSSILASKGKGTGSFRRGALSPCAFARFPERRSGTSARDSDVVSEILLRAYASLDVAQASEGHESLGSMPSDENVGIDSIGPEACRRNVRGLDA